MQKVFNLNKIICLTISYLKKIKKSSLFFSMIRKSQISALVNRFIMNLSDVKKTLIVKDISEHFQRSLYSVRVYKCSRDSVNIKQINVNELKRNSDKLEENLNSILHLISHWKTILLLNEVNVFLKQRLFEMLFNNALVFVFLRKLKYFQSIMFLTTNRIRIFNEAIISRVHFSLRFNHFNAQIRKNI